MYINKLIIPFFIYFFSVMFPFVSYSLGPCPHTSNSLDNCFKSVDFKNGDKYIGEWQKNKMHGKGIYIFANGERLEGIWKDGIETSNLSKSSIYKIIELSYDKILKLDDNLTQLKISLYSSKISEKEQQNLIEVLSVIEKQLNLIEKDINRISSKIAKNEKPFFNSYLRKFDQVNNSFIEVYKELNSLSHTKEVLVENPLADEDDKYICERASYISDSIRVWHPNSYSIVKEAKRRGLDCGVGKVVNPKIASKSNNFMNVNLKNTLDDYVWCVDDSWYDTPLAIKKEKFKKCS